MDKKYEFCHNHKQWILFLVRPHKTCPLYQEQLMCYEKCGYYELRIPTKYFLRKLNSIKQFKREYNAIEKFGNI